MNNNDSYSNSGMNTQKPYKHFLVILFAFIAFYLHAEIPVGYYKNAEGKSGAALKTALYNIIQSHTQLDYYSSSTYFRTTDWRPATTSYPQGYFWDMYSNNIRTSWSGGLLNREHSLPKSWFGISSGSENTNPAGTDLHNLYPSDAEANSAKSNYPLGEVTGTPIYSNGVVKVGTNGASFSENGNTLKYNNAVFEPANEYKGDFARDYMYMVTCYENFSSRWQSTGTSSMIIGGSTYPVFNRWAINLLLKWHRQDTVSTKEKDRNDAVYGLQGNRNPFIDHPELVEFIWGSYTDLPWSAGVELPKEDLPFEVYYAGDGSYIKVNVNAPEKTYYKITTLNGLILRSGALNENAQITLIGLNKGLYILEVFTTGKNRYSTKLAVT